MQSTTGMNRRTLLKVVGAGSLGAATIGSIGHNQIALAGTHRIIPRSEWGFDGWTNGGPSSLDPSALTHFVVHHHGPSGGGTTGVAAPRKVHRIGKGGADNGSGFRYNFLITQQGEIYQGRGFALLQGATKGANDFSLSAQIHISGDMEPSEEALTSLEWLYRRSHEVLSKDIDAALKITGHKEHTATACPGTALAAWVDGPGQRLYRETKADLGGHDPA